MLSQALCHPAHLYTYKFKLERASTQQHMELLD